MTSIRIYSLAAGAALMVGLAATPARADYHLTFNITNDNAGAGQVAFQNVGSGGNARLEGSKIDVFRINATGGTAADGARQVTNTGGNPLTDAKLTFETGKIVSETTDGFGGFTMKFDFGGYYYIVGDVPSVPGTNTGGTGSPSTDAAPDVLVRGHFFSSVSFNPQVGGNAFLATFSGVGDDDYINPALAAFYGWPVAPIFSFSLVLNIDNPPGASKQNCVSYADCTAGPNAIADFDVAVNSGSEDNKTSVPPPPRVPEPASLLLLGSGLSMVGAVIRRRSAKRG